MARSMNMKVFYIGLGVIAVAGGVALWLAARGGGGGPVSVAPMPVDIGSFDGYTIGSDSAPVEVVEFADFQCPACARFAILTAPDLKSRLVATGRVRWTFRDFPLPIHDKAELAHHAAACAGEQDLFWPMHDQLFFTQGAWARDRRPERRFEDYAEAIGADVDRYEECMDSDRYVGRIQSMKAEASGLGVSATPSFLVGDLLVSGAVSYDSLATLVERAERNAARP